MITTLPRILIIDDLFGRSVPGGRNADRENLCAHFLWEDNTDDAAAKASQQKILKPVARAVFCRGQIPEMAEAGAVIENDLQGSLAKVRHGWTEAMAQGEPPWAMVLLDLCFYTGLVTDESHRRTPGMPEGRLGDDDPRHYFGLILLDAIHREFPELPIFVLSSKPRKEVSLEFSRLGALGFIDRSGLRGPELLKEALWHHGLLPDATGEVIGNSLPVLLALREARRAARHRDNLLIRGERGTGKELLANYIHQVGNLAAERGDCPFVTVNSAMLTPNLFSSELFGIEPRTASGVDGKIGLIETANHGDLFLDEIADMPIEVQAAVLRVLQERQIIPVGARRPRAVDVRFLSATNADLEDKARGFRPDLLDRLRVGGTLWLPPLRERKTDIPLLANNFVREAETHRKGGMRREITSEALDVLKESEWPGNVRELRACLFDAVNRHPDVEHLVLGHLRIASKAARKKSGSPVLQPAESISNRGTDLGLDGLESLLNFQDQVVFDETEIGRWSGRLSDLERSNDRVLARYLLAALKATKRRTPEQPEGILQIHPAVKLMTGDQTITASKAADIIKRLLRPLENELGGDLRDAFDTAIRLRPRSAKASSRKGP
jgi:DNA-binding NtrC family response regulator